MATHSSTLAWKIPWKEEPGRIQSIGSQRVRHDEQLHFSKKKYFTCHFSWGCRILRCVRYVGMSSDVLRCIDMSLLIATLTCCVVVVVQLLIRVQLFATPRTAACQASLFFTNSWNYSNSRPLSQRCHPTISSSVVPFSCLQCFPASGYFLMS